MLILADNDVGGAVAALRRILESEEWAAFSATLSAVMDLNPVIAINLVDIRTCRPELLAAIEQEGIAL